MESYLYLGLYRTSGKFKIAAILLMTSQYPERNLVGHKVLDKTVCYKFTLKIPLEYVLEIDTTYKILANFKASYTSFIRILSHKTTIFRNCIYI